MRELRPESPDPTLDQLLDRAAGFPAAGLRFVDRRDREEWVSWARIRDGAVPVAAALSHLGVGPGDRVALVHSTGREFFHAFFGALLAAAVPVPLAAPVRLGRLDEYHRRTAAMLAAAGARWVLTARRLGPLLAPSVAAAGARCVDPGELAASARGTPRRRVDPAALALVQFSSGTTVDPRPVALSHRALVAQARILNGFWPDRDGLRHSGVSWLPLHHDMGLIGCVLPALERPGVLTLLAPEVFVARPAKWLRALSRYRATISAAPNFAYALCAEKIRDHELDGVDLGAWMVALTGAEQVAPEVLRRFQARFAPWGFRPEALTPVYGLAEASLAVTFSDLGRPFNARRFDRQGLAAGHARPQPDGVELVAVGTPVPGFAVRIADDDGASLPERRVGRVLARGPSLMAGYLGQPAATARALSGGWLDTGDLGFLDGGELFLTGRAKDVVILRGRNHSPLEIERALAGVAGVRDGAAVAVSCLAEGAATEELLLFVERARAGGGDLAALSQACAEAVLGATGLAVAAVQVLDPGTLPRTTSGKLRRRETLRRHLEGTLP